MINCPKCGEELEDGAVFCTNCGTKLSVECPKCGKVLKSGAKFCSGCGANLAELAEEENKPTACPNCGAELEDGAQFCDQCGHKIGGEEAAIQHHTDKPTSDSQEAFEYEGVSYAFGTYDAVVPWTNDYDMSLDDAIQYGDLDKARELIESGSKIKDISFYSLCNVHNGEMLDFLFEHGNVNCYDSEYDEDLLEKIIDNYSSALYNYNKDSDYDFAYWSKDRFDSEQDIHNKYFGIIKVLLERQYDVNDTLSDYKTLLMKALYPYFSDYPLTRLALYLIEKCGANVNLVPKIDAETKYNSDLEYCKENDMEVEYELADYYKIREDSPLILACEIESKSAAAYKEKYALCKLLINHNADVNYKSYHISFCSMESSSTPLEQALWRIKEDAEFDSDCSIISLLSEENAEITDDIVDQVICVEDEDLKEKLCKILALTDDQLNEAYERAEAMENAIEAAFSEWNNDSDDSDEEDYDDDESTEEKIQKIVDKYIFDINKSSTAYNSSELHDYKYSQVLQNIRSYIAKDASSSEIIGFIDTTVFGKGKAGLVFTTEALYEGSAGASWKVPYWQMNQMEYSGKKIVFNGTDDCGIGWLKKGMDIDIDSTWYNIPALKDCLDEILAII